MRLADLEIIKILGAGGSGRAYLARNRLTLELLALKILFKAERSPAQL